jgi:hypothetical protein
MAPAKHALRIERRPASCATNSSPTFTHDRRGRRTQTYPLLGGASLRRQNSVAMELQHQLQRAVSFDGKKTGLSINVDILRCPQQKNCCQSRIGSRNRC